MRRSALAALAAASSLLTWPGAAQPLEEPETDAVAEAPAPRRIHVQIAAEPAAREALTRVLAELMQRVSVEMEVEPSERADLAALLAPQAVAQTYLARCLLDLSSPTEAALLVHDPARDRVLERRFARTPGDDELAQEELGHMLLAAVEGLLSGAALGTPRSDVLSAAEAAHVAVPPPSETEPESESAPSSARSFRIRTALLYEAAMLGHAPGFAHGPQLAVVIRTPLEPVLGLQLSAQYQVPYDLDTAPVGMRLQAIPLRALATLETELTARVSLRFGLGGGADVARLQPTAEAGERVAATAPRTLLFGVARALAGVEVRLARLLALWAALAVDADFDRTEYVLERSDGATSEVAAPWRVRPALSLGVALP